MAKDKPLLTDNDKTQIDSLLVSGKDVTEITKTIFKNDQLDTRSVEGRVIKEYIASKGIALPQKEYYTPVDFALTEEQKLFIRQNVKNVQNATEMARLVIESNRTDGYKIAPNGREYRTVSAYMKEIDPQSIDKNDELCDGDFRAPQSIQQLLGWCNLYVPTGHPDKTTYSTKTKLKPSEEVNLRALLSYIKTASFAAKANSFDKEWARELFVSTFIRWTHNKPELSQPQADLYVQAASQAVEIEVLGKRHRLISNAVDESLTSDDPDKKRLSLNALSEVNRSFDNCEAAKSRLSSLLKALEGDRAKMESTKIQRNQSMLQFIEAWINEEKRADLIKIGIKEQLADSEEQRRIESLDDIPALIVGMTVNEASNGL